MYYASHSQLLLGPSTALANPILGKLLVDGIEDDEEWRRNGGYNMPGATSIDGESWQITSTAWLKGKTAYIHVTGEGRNGIFEVSDCRCRSRLDHENGDIVKLAVRGARHGTHPPSAYFVVPTVSHSLRSSGLE